MVKGLQQFQEKAEDIEGIEEAIKFIKRFS
jgi:hypothetical protein